MRFANKIASAYAAVLGFFCCGRAYRKSRASESHAGESRDVCSEPVLRVRQQWPNRVWFFQREHMKNLIRLFPESRGYIESKDFEDLDIKCSDFDLLQDDPVKGILLKPGDISKISNLVEVLDPNPILREPLIAGSLDNFEEALTMAGLIQDCVSKALGFGTPWRARELREGSEKTLEIEEGQEEMWKAAFILDQQNGTPHVSPVLVDNLEMQPDNLTMAEYLCMISCTKSRLHQDQQYQRHRIIPVTVISLSMRSARVMHSYFDAKDENLRVFKSQIIKLQGDEGIGNMHKLLSWCIAEPTGKTEWEDER